MTRRSRAPLRSSLAAAVAAIAIVLASAPARADATDGESAPTDDAATIARIADVQSALDEQAPRARLWWDGFLVGYAGAALAQGGLAFAVHDEGMRVDLAIGAAKSALGAGALLVMPRTPRWAASALRDADASTPAARRAKLALAEKLLDEAAETERLGHAWLAHAGAIGVNAAGAAVGWFGYDRRATAIGGLAIGVAVAEIQIATMPTAAVDARDRLRQGATRVGVAAWPGGAELRIAF